MILEIPTTQSDFLFNEKSQTILPFIVFIHADSNNLETKHCHFIGICDTPVYLRCSHAFLSDFASQLINLLRAIAFFSLHSGGLQQNLPYDRGDSKSFKKEGGGILQRCRGIKTSPQNVQKDTFGGPCPQKGLANRKLGTFPI